MADQSPMLDQVRRVFEYAGADVDRAHEIYHDDAVLEFPQSGERFEGVDTFTEWRRQYPPRCSTGSDGSRRERTLPSSNSRSATTTVLRQYGVQLLEFRNDKVARERIYVMDGWEAPDWRARWRSETPADPPS